MPKKETNSKLNLTKRIHDIDISFPHRAPNRCGGSFVTETMIWSKQPMLKWAMNYNLGMLRM
jgi:hypothetical protein